MVDAKPRGRMVRTSKTNPIKLTLDRVFYLWSLICRY
nr:MAG TPA: hypothetical protein [Bacteriophage sp.]